MYRLLLIILLAGQFGWAQSVRLELVHQHPQPVIGKTEGNRYGFEGGRVVLLEGTYHLFVSEMIDNPKWAKTRLAHWTSEDRIHWKRISTLFESSGEYAGKDQRAALFLPIPVYDEQIQRWTLFYSAFRSAPNANGKWLINHDGKIWRALSKTPGREGIGGPYEDAGVVLRPGGDSDRWEGLQGTDSFFPFHAPGEKGWLAFYGSAHTQKWPCDFWGVGLVAAERLEGPWKRLSSLNPVPIDPVWVENPHVIKLPDGRLLAVFDATPKGRCIGYTTSRDGLHWEKGSYLELEKGEGNWLKQPRTPIGLLRRADGRYDLFFTAYDQQGYGCVAWAVVTVSDGR